MAMGYLGGAMSIRVNVQTDQTSESWRYIATATLDGKCLHEVRKYCGPEDLDKVLRKMAEWLEGQGYSVPDYYWLKQFSPEEQWLPQPFPK